MLPQVPSIPSNSLTLPQAPSNSLMLSQAPSTLSNSLEHVRRALRMDAADRMAVRVKYVAHVARMLRLVGGRGLHSSTFRINVSAFRGIGGAFKGF